MSIYKFDLQKKRCVLLLCVMFLSSCIAPDIPNGLNTPSALHEGTPTIISSTEVSISALPVDDTLMPNQWIAKRCLEYKSHIAILPVGNVVVRDHSEHLLLLNVETGETEALTDNSVVAEISPDGKWLAYYPILPRNEIQSMNLTVLSAERNVYKVIPWEKDWTTFRWANNHQLIIGRMNSASTPPVPEDFVLLDIGLGRQEELPYIYPDMAANSPPIAWQNTWPDVYDPTLMRVAYTKASFDFPKVALWDLTDKRELATINVVDTHLYATEPKWSPDGAKFIISALFEIDKANATYGNDLFSVSRDGKIDRLTYFTDASGHASSTIQDYVWSPSGRYVGLWMESENKKIWFGMLNPETKTMTDFCISGILGNKNFVSTVWSPDSTSLLAIFQDDSGRTRIVQIDPSEGLGSVTLAEGIIPIGWMIAPR